MFQIIVLLLILWLHLFEWLFLCFIFQLRVNRIKINIINCLHSVSYASSISFTLSLIVNGHLHQSQPIYLTSHYIFSFYYYFNWSLCSYVILWFILFLLSKRNFLFVKYILLRIYLQNFAIFHFWYENFVQIVSVIWLRCPFTLI